MSLLINSRCFVWLVAANRDRSFGVGGRESCVSVQGYSCYPSFCASDAKVHDPVPQCGPALAELKLGGKSLSERVDEMKSWCDKNSSCSGFAIDPSFPVMLAFSSRNFTAAAQPNKEWIAWWRGAPQPLPSPTPAPAPAWTPILPRGPCEKDEDCSLNGECEGGVCKCYDGWHGHNCQHLSLGPLPPIAAYGESPNVTSWGGSIFVTSKADNKSVYHLFVTEETEGKGLGSWSSSSQIVHAVSASPTGPYVKNNVVMKPSHSNPQVLYDAQSNCLLLYHISGSGSVGLLTANLTGAPVDGPYPWRPQHVPFGCNNPTAAFAPNGTLYVVCHNGPFEMYFAHPTATAPAWEQSQWHGPVDIFGGDPQAAGGSHPNAPGNCEDPWIFFDRKGYFHVIAHCYTCYWFPFDHRPYGDSGGLSVSEASGNCSANVTCSGHGFSRSGLPSAWTWVGGPDAPYDFTSANADGSTRLFSTRERPWGLLGGRHGDQILALINGVSPAAPEYVKYQKGRDWCYTNIQPVLST